MATALRVLEGEVVSTDVGRGLSEGAAEEWDSSVLLLGLPLVWLSRELSVQSYHESWMVLKDCWANFKEHSISQTLRICSLLSWSI